MIRTYKVNRSQLIEKIGEVISPFDKVGLGWNKFEVYIDGQVKVWIKSKLTKEEFYKLCGDG